MTPQEREQLTRFLDQLVEARVSDKDPEAETLIRAAAARQPDAAYLLVQRAMLLEQALDSATAQIARLEGQVRASQNRGQSSFLGGGNPWASASSALTKPGGVPGAGDYPFPRAQQSAATGGGASSFLGNIATTAAGVVAGSFLFQGIENLLGHHRAASSWIDASGERVSEQTTVNNVSGSADEGQAQGHAAALLASEDDASFLDEDSVMNDGDDSNWV
jgi:hypothetical protein